MRRYAWALALASAVVAIPPAPAAADAPQVLSVLGNGKVFVRPDVADVTVSVMQSAATSRVALSHVNSRSDAIVRGIRGLGIPAEDVQTQNVNVYKNTPQPGETVPPGQLWTASQDINVHITNIKLVGRAIDGSISRGATSIDGPNYSFSDPSAGLRGATRAAIADALKRAEDAAAAVGDKVTGVDSMDLDPGSGDNQGVHQPKSISGFTSGSGPHRKPKPHRVRTNIRPGAQEVDAQVAIIYTIAPA